MNQPTLFGPPDAYGDLGTPRGDTFDPSLDGARLKGQAKRVFIVMQRGQWMTLREIATETGDPEASVSARLRDFRHAGFTVSRRRRGEPSSGTFEYQLEVGEG